jgi:hypothetical protein
MAGRLDAEVRNLQSFTQKNHFSNSKATLNQNQLVDETNQISI